MLCETEIRRTLLKHAIALLPEENKQQGFELMWLLDENRIRLTQFGEFHPDNNIKPIPETNIVQLVKHAVMKPKSQTCRSCPKGYLEFLSQLRKYKQHHYFHIPNDPPCTQAKDKAKQYFSPNSIWFGKNPKRLKQSDCIY